MTRTLRSNGESTLAVYLAPHPLPGPTCAPRATQDSERVAISDPRSTITVKLRALSPRSGPRNPEQRMLRSSEPCVELPDGRPLTRAQRVIVPPELIALWRQQRAEGSTT